MSLTSFPDINTIKPKASTSSETDHEGCDIDTGIDVDVDINNILQKYLKMDSPTFSKSPDIEYEACHINDLVQKYLHSTSPSTSCSSQCDFLFDDNNDSNSDNKDTNGCNKYHIDVPSLTLSNIRNSSIIYSPSPSWAALSAHETETKSPVLSSNK